MKGSRDVSFLLDPSALPGRHSLRTAVHWPGVLALVGAVFLPAGGCRNCDLVEAELRTREKELRHLKDELYRTEIYNDALQRELHVVRPGGGSSVSPEQASQTYTLKEIVLARQTGGYDQDGKPGDEALQVVLEPRDPDGHAIKAPGSLYVEVVQITPEGLKTPLCSWQIPPDQLRRSWKSGLFTTGYYLVLPWKVWPSTPKLRVTARFTLADQRVFEADKDITIRLAPQASPKSGPILTPEATPIPVVPEEEMLLPAPRKSQSEKPNDRTHGPQPQGDKDDDRSTSWQRTVTVPKGEEVRLLPPEPAR